jgi:HK97 family phage prohead protease
MQIEIRGNTATIEGYVNAVERDSRILNKAMAPNATSTFVEKVKSKTFEKALSKNDDIEVRYNHAKTLGSTKQGNLTLYEDNIGLYAKATITDTEVIDKARNNELRGWSFGFVANADKWDSVDENLQRRTLEDIDLREVSILTNTPAYIATSIEMRDGECAIIEKRGTAETPKVNIIEVDYSIQEQEIELLKLKKY